MLLMAAAVFAMVTFSALVYAPDALKRLTGNPEDKVAFMKIYDQPIPRIQGHTVQDRLATSAQFESWIRQQYGILQYRSQINPQDPNIQKEASQLYLMRSYNTGLPTEYQKASEAGRAQQRKVLEDTIVLLHEAERAGIRVTDDMVQAFVDRWKAAGITEERIQEIRGQFFVKNGEDYFLKALGQEMTLMIYFNSLISDARVFKDDVAQEFSLANDKIMLRDVTVNTADYLKKAPEPTEEQIKAQYEKYKNILATDTPDASGVVQPFGYKIPDRVKFSYLSAALADAEKEIKVSDDEIKQYYESHKDSFEISAEIKPQEPKAEEQKSEAPKADEKKAVANEKSGQAAPAKAKVLNAPAAADETAKAASTAVNTAAKAVPATTAAPATSATAATAVNPAVPPVRMAPPVQAAPSLVPEYLAAPSTAAVPEMPKPKKYKPLDQVRDEIAKTLRRQKAAEATWKRCQDAINALGAHPQLTFENVADERYMKIHHTSGLLSAKQVARISGIGRSEYIENPQERMGAGTPLDKVVFMTKPFVKDVKEEKVHLNRPFGPLVEENLGKIEAMYVLFLTEAEAARPPTALDEVRARVITDLKKLAAFDLAKKAADELLEQARAKGLDEAAKAQELKAEKAPQTLMRAEAQSKSNPLAKAAFDVADAKQKYGKVDSPTFDQVRVFEVTEVLYGTQKQYLEDRGQLAATAIGRARSKLIQELLDPVNIRKRSHLQQLEPLVQGEKVIQGAEQNDSTPEDSD
jgi:hypothetical protein